MLCLTHSCYVEKQASELWLPVGWHLLPGFPKPLLVTQEEMHTDMFVIEVKLCRKPSKTRIYSRSLQLWVNHYQFCCCLNEHPFLGTNVSHLCFFRDSKLKQTQLCKETEGLGVELWIWVRGGLKFHVFVYGAFTGICPIAASLVGWTSVLWHDGILEWKKCPPLVSQNS